MGVVQNSIDIQKIIEAGGDPTIAAKVQELEAEIGDENSGIIKDIDDLQQDVTNITTDATETVTTTYTIGANTNILRKRDKWVQLDLRLLGIENLNAWTTFGTIPEGFRPRENCIFPVYASGSACSVIADTSGNLQLLRNITTSENVYIHAIWETA